MRSLRLHAHIGEQVDHGLLDIFADRGRQTILESMLVI